MSDERRDLLDRYRDGDLDPQARAAFERELARDPRLAAELKLQEKIDASLGRSFSPPDVDAILARAKKPRSGGRRWKLLLLAGLVVAGLGGVAFMTSRPQPEEEAPNTKPRPLDVIYEQRVKDGFKPDWVCKNPSEFTKGIELKLTASLTFDDDSDVKSLGLAYVNALSFNTVAVLVRVEGKPVIVFLDKVDPSPKLSPSSTLHLYPGKVAGLVAYEVSPFAESKALSHLHPK